MTNKKKSLLEEYKSVIITALITTMIGSVAVGATAYVKGAVMAPIKIEELDRRLKKLEETVRIHKTGTRTHLDIRKELKSKKDK